LTDHDKVTRFFNIFRAFTFNEQILFDSSYYTTYEVNNDDWWDNISQRFYRTPNLWWAIAELNGVVSPFEELEAGDNIKILRPEYLYVLMRDIERIAEY